MSKKIHLLAVAAFFTAAAASMTPGDARADELQDLLTCLKSAKGSADEEQARSICLWKHYDYMASYGP